MKLLAILNVSLSALRANALRSFLAMLGVIIGVGSVIVMVSISQGASREVDRRISNLGANLFVIRPGAVAFGPRSGGAGTDLPFSDDDVEAIRTQVEGVAAVSGVVQGEATLVSGSTNWSSSLYGVNSSYLEVRDWPILEGRVFSDQEVRGGAKVVVLGQTIAQELFGDINVVGQTLRIKNVPFTVIGILDKKGNNAFGSDQDDIAMVPISTARKRIVGDHTFVRDHARSIMAEATTLDIMPQVQADIQDLLRVRRKIRPGDKDNFSVNNLTDFIRARSETQATLSVLLAATATISLIVGGIGIMNIMLVSVTERTREIGTRMAVGAKRGDIRNQFLIEAVVLCLTGGLVGLAFGAAGTYALSKLGSWPVALDPTVILIALASSAGVGVFFGFYPAQQASRMNPIDALRYE